MASWSRGKLIWWQLISWELISWKEAEKTTPQRFSAVVCSISNCLCIPAGWFCQCSWVSRAWTIRARGWHNTNLFVHSLPSPSHTMHTCMHAHMHAHTYPHTHEYIHSVGEDCPPHRSTWGTWGYCWVTAGGKCWPRPDKEGDLHIPHTAVMMTWPRPSAYQSWTTHITIFMMSGCGLSLLMHKDRISTY